MEEDAHVRSPTATAARSSDISDAIAKLPLYPLTTSFGEDIDAANAVLHDPKASDEAKIEAVLKWSERSQPCLFGRIAAKSQLGLSAPRVLRIDLSILNDNDLDAGIEHLTSRVQEARSNWKREALDGRSSFLMILFNSARLARARPSEELSELFRMLASTYLVEHAPVQTDTIYLETIPLREADGRAQLFKASTQLFYTGAHLRRNHDHRCPGGIAIASTSGGHYAHSLARHGGADDLEDALKFVHTTALRTVGRGGTSHPDGLGSTWWNWPEGTKCPVGNPSAAEADQKTYSTTYQVDVLIQQDVVTDPREWRAPHPESAIWPATLDYLKSEDVPQDDPDFGWSRGLFVDAKSFERTVWEPIVASRDPEFDY